MKALTVKMEKFLELTQKKTLDPDFKPKIYDLVDLENVPEIKLINENWVKVKVKLGGICGTDLSLLSLRVSTSYSNFASLPMIPGHEIVGTIVEIGDNVNNISIGDRIIIEPSLACKVREVEPCSNCKEGQYNLCSNLDQGIIAPGLLLGFCEDTGGGWGEFVVAHKSQIFKLPDNISFEEALIIEPLAVAIHGVFKSLPKKGDNCVVIGCGTIGLATIIALKAYSKCNIIAVAKYPFQSELAKALGADEVYLVKKDLHIKKIGRKLGCRILSPVMEDALPMGGGADIVIDSVGSESSLSNCIRLVRPQGTLILIGAPSYITVDWMPMLFKEVNVVPAITYSHETINDKKIRTFQLALDLISSGNVNVKDFVSHKFTIDNYQDALEVASNKSDNNTIKAAFVFQ